MLIAHYGVEDALVAIIAANACVQFCPMATEGKGAFWLSNSREIRNPCYGAKLFKCGSVKREI